MPLLGFRKKDKTEVVSGKNGNGSSSGGGSHKKSKKDASSATATNGDAVRRPSSNGSRGGGEEDVGLLQRVICSRNRTQYLSGDNSSCGSSRDSRRGGGGSSSNNKKVKQKKQQQKKKQQRPDAEAGLSSSVKSSGSSSASFSTGREGLPDSLHVVGGMISSFGSSGYNSDFGGDDSSHGSRCSRGSASSRNNSFKKETLRRSCSTTGSNPKMLSHSTSAIGLDEMIEDRREGGHLGQNVVHIEVPFGKPIEEVYEGVHNGPVLGSGIAGMVRLVTHKATGLKYAVKVLDLGLVETPTGLQQLREEIFIMCQLDHPNIVRLEEVYESHTEIYLVQELCLGGELFDRLDEQPDYHYTEMECARLVKQMLSAVRYLHSKGIIHRDLKLENFLFSSVHPDSELKMIDFGLSKHFRYGEVHHEAVGTPYTVAPEVIRGTYDERCDIWAIGVISFLLLSGEPPFGGCGGPEPLMTVRSNILNGSYAFEPTEIWGLVSPQALGFIRSLLVTDPKARPTAQRAQLHEWFQEWKPRRQNGDNALSPNVVKALVNFKEFSDMRKLLCEVLSFTLLPDQIRDLRREFEKMDTDGSGEISLTALKQVLMQNAGAGSLGALTEEEVTDIFDAMRVRKTETRIHWHEFIAAGLSQCSVDDRNLRLAFERLDSDHKGYIILDDIMDLMGSDALQSEDEMRQMWGDSIKAVKCQSARITYDDFLLLMKGQTRENPPDHLSQRKMPAIDPAALATLGASLGGLHAAPESSALEQGGSRATPRGPEDAESIVSPPLLGPGSSHSAPSTPLEQKKIIELGENDEFMDSPLSMDDGIPAPSPLTPPMTPERGAQDYLSPRNPPLHLVVLSSAAQANAPVVPSFDAFENQTRRRSRSLGEQGDVGGQKDDSEQTRASEDATHEDLHAMADAVRDLILPEADHYGAQVPPQLGEVVKDKTKSVLVVNRRLYRAHRQMRIAVLDASKRFEEQQAQHARDVILAQREQDGVASGGAIHAGLVMRHGHTKQVSSEAIRAMLARDRAEQQSLVEKATRRGGRGRRSRKKTISDMSGMLTSAEAMTVSTVEVLASERRLSDRDLGGSTSSRNEMFSQSSSGYLAEGDEPKPVVGQGELHSMQTSSVAPENSALSPSALLASTQATTTTESRSGTIENGIEDHIISTATGNTTNNGTPSAATAKEGTMRSATVPGDFRKTSDPFGSQGKYGATLSKWK